MFISWRTLAVVCVTGVVLLAAPLALANENQKSAANETTAATVAKDQVKQRVYLGVAVEPLHPSLWVHLRDVLEHKQGLMVAHVAKDSPAAKAGIQTHDILMNYGDQKLFSPQQLAGLIQSDKAGQVVSMGIVRGGKSQAIRVTLGEHATQTAAPVGRHEMWRPSWFRSRTAPAENNSSWDSFDSMSLKSLDDNRFQVEIAYETKGGKIEHRTFEGTREEIQKDLKAQQDLPDNEREHLLRGLDMQDNKFPIEFNFPGVHYTPGGGRIWDFDDLDSVLSPALPNAF